MTVHYEITQLPYRDRKNHALWIILPIILVVATWILYPKGYAFSDPVAYLKRASEFTNLGQWEFNHPFDHRLGLLISHWLSFKAFGVSTWSAYLPQIVIFCILLISVLQKVPTPSGRLYAIATLLLLLPQTVTVFPDLGVATFMFLAVLILERRQGALRGVLFIFAAFSAFLFKETAVFLIVLFLALLVNDVIRQKSQYAGRIIFYASAITAAVLVSALYLMAYQGLVGDPFARLTTTENFGEKHLWSMSGLGDLLKRLIIDPPGFLLGYTGGTILLALLGAILEIQKNGKHKVIASYLFVGLTLFIFASVSLSSYHPLPLMDRMSAFIIPPMAVLAANVLPKLADRMTSAQASQQAIKAMFLLLAVHWAGVPIAKEFHRGNTSQLHDMRQNIASEMIIDPRAHLLVAENRTPMMLDIYFDFDGPDPSRVTVCPESLDRLDAGTTFVLIDYPRARFLARAYGSETCTTELEAIVRQAEFEILVDEPWLFVARR